MTRDEMLAALLDKRKPISMRVRREIAAELAGNAVAPIEDPLTEPCPHDCARFGGRVPGWVRGSNWDFVPCWCNGTGRVPRTADKGVFEPKCETPGRIIP